MDDLDKQIIRDYCQGTLEELEADLSHWSDKWTWDDDSEWTHAIVKQLEQVIEEKKARVGFYIIDMEITNAKIADGAITYSIANGSVSSVR